MRNVVVQAYLFLKLPTYILLPMLPAVDSPHYNVPHGWFASQVEVAEPQVEQAEDHYPT